MELEQNVNASGKARTGDTARVFSEIGMGLIGNLTSLAVSAGIGFATAASMENHPHDMGATFFVPAFISYMLTSPALQAGGVYLGGWVTGGRAKAWLPFVGAYLGAIPGYALIADGLFGSQRDSFLAIVFLRFLFSALREPSLAMNCPKSTRRTVSNPSATSSKDRHRS